LEGLLGDAEDTLVYAAGGRVESYMFANMMGRWAMACWKAGISFDEVLDAAFIKLEINRRREWPKPAGNDEPVEHVRDTE
jgi:hypothetical protein